MAGREASRSGEGWSTSGGGRALFQEAGNDLQQLAWIGFNEEVGRRGAILAKALQSDDGSGAASPKGSDQSVFFGLGDRVAENEKLKAGSVSAQAQAFLKSAGGNNFAT